jgi:hypothetical protein
MKRGASWALLLSITLLAWVPAACGGADITPPTNNIDKAKEVSAKAEIMIVKTGVASYVAANSALPPAATQEALGSFVSPWPDNPWTGAPMTSGTQPGDIVYKPGAGLDYSLGVHLSDGSVYTAP